MLARRWGRSTTKTTFAVSVAVRCWWVLHASSTGSGPTAPTATPLSSRIAAPNAMNPFSRIRSKPWARAGTHIKHHLHDQHTNLQHCFFRYGIKLIGVLQRHAHHFSCCVCQRSFTQGTPFCEKDGQAYCERDFNNTFLPKCGKCNQVRPAIMIIRHLILPIQWIWQVIEDDSCISALGKKWHPAHFTCVVCDVRLFVLLFFYSFLINRASQVVLDAGSPVYAHQGRPYCTNDYPEDDGDETDDQPPLAALPTTGIFQPCPRSHSTQFSLFSFNTLHLLLPTKVSASSARARSAARPTER